MSGSAFKIRRCDMRNIFHAVLAFILLTGSSGAVTFKQHWIIIMNADNPFYGYPSEAPMYEVVFRDVHRAYPGLFNDTVRTILYQPGPFTCPESASVMLMIWGKISQALQSYPDHWPVLFSPGCSNEILPLGDFAREWDIPLIAGIASDPYLHDKNRYPTVVSFPGSDQESLNNALVLFLQRYSWITLTIFIDSVSQYGALKTFYSGYSASLIRALQERIGKYTIYRSFFDSKNFNSSNDSEALLEPMKRQSRVAVFFTHPKVLRTFLVAAYRLNMTNGDYIFFSVQPALVPSMEDVTWRHSDGDDEVALEAYKSLIVCQNPDADWSKIPDVLEQYRDASLRLFNKSMRPDSIRNDLSITVYESVMTFAKVLNESANRVTHPTNGTTFARLFWNRFFPSASRNFDIDATGMRVDDTVFYRMDFTTRNMQVAWRYYALRRALEPVSNVSNQWYGQNGPPQNDPTCGFLSNLCFSTDGNTGMISGIVSALTVVLLGTAFAVVYWRNLHRKDSSSTWWQLDQTGLGEIDQTDPKLFEVLRAERRICPWSPAKVCKFVDKAVYMTPLGSGVRGLNFISNNKTARSVLNMLRQLNHTNVAQFFGIVQVDSSTIFMVFEYGNRGSLRSLLQSGNVTIDETLQSSLIWEIASGLQYIHSSPLHFHGHLTSFDITVDKRFCVQICSTAVPKLRRMLGIKNSTNVKPASLWAPPEALQDESFVGSREGDIFSLGILICEILTKQTPLNTNFADRKAVEASVDAMESYPAEPRMSSLNIPIKLYEVVSRCFDSAPHNRPTLQKLRPELEQQVPRIQLVDILVRRLEHYAQDLEETVGRRTRELIEEQRKVDELLIEIIPRFLVSSLRNKIPVPAELFDCVTILFSDIPVFASICAVCLPLQTTVLLNSVYSLCDRILHRFDVYKVETINDSYIVASGLPVRNGNLHAGETAQMALAMLEATSELVSPIDPGERVLLRIGINSGPCAAGMVGLKMPRYCVFGDTMNTASRMESHGKAGEIHMSTAANGLLDGLGGFRTVSRGLVPIKGKGEMETFWLRK